MTLPDTRAEAAPATAPIVHLLVLLGAPAIAPRLVADLRAELGGVIAILEDVAAATARPPVAGSIYIAWLPARAEPAVLEALVAWSGSAEPRPGLVACVPTGTTEDAEAALAAGFDDAVVGTPSVRELAARLRAVHRRVHRVGAARPMRLHHGPMTLHLDSHELWVDGCAIGLTTTEAAVLRALIRARGRIMSRADLLEAAWRDEQFEVTDRAVDNVILRLRRKLPRPELIQTVRGVGFRLGA